MAEPAIAVAAPAKINLYLHVLGRRADGYHDLDSLVAFAGVGDVVEVGAFGRDPHPGPLPQAGEGVGSAPSSPLPPAGEVGERSEPGEGGATITVADGTLALAIAGPFAAELRDAGADNLVLRAARALAAKAEIKPKAAIRLTKNLPVASGIGGGSADAAATLRALSRLWKIDLAPAELSKLAFTLGADVPVCLACRAAFFGGAGEEVAFAPSLPAAGLVLVNPRRPVMTSAVFKARGGVFSRPGRFDSAPGDAAALAALLRDRDNDLTAAAITLEPMIAQVLGALAATPDCLLARMSGSGATCFGLYADEAVAARAAAGLVRDFPGWWVAATAIAGARD